MFGKMLRPPLRFVVSQLLTGEISYNDGNPLKTYIPLLLGNL